MAELKQIGRYEIKTELGRGGMATVYLAHDPRFKRDVAVKILPRQYTHDPMFRARFEREAQTIAALEHPAIVPVYDFGEEDSQPYLVMRYMPGGSLSERMDKGLLPLMEVVKILDRVASALDLAHRKGIIHRDLKPGNILFDQEDNAFLADFGIAKMAEATAALTGSAIIGTPAYMSPEQVIGQKVDARSDIYTLGVILFELLTGKRPFESDTPMGLAFKHVHEPAPHLMDTKEELPLGLDLTINQAMAKEADKRFSTAGDLAASVKANVQQTSSSVPDKTAIKPNLPTGFLDSVEPAQPPDPNIPTGFLPSANTGIPTEVIPEDELAEYPLPELEPEIPKSVALAEEKRTVPGQPGTVSPEESGKKWPKFPWWWGVTAVIVIGLLIFAGVQLFSDGDSPAASDEPSASPQVEQAAIITFIQEKWDQAYRVTDLGYGNDAWGIVMSQDSPYGRQTWQTEEAFPETFIRTKWEEGFRVTNLAFGNGVWAVVMSQGSPFGRQTWLTEQTFPGEFIRAKWEEGFRVTSLSYGNGVWAVIMSEGSLYGRQTWQTEQAFPEEFIRAKWEEGFRITSVAYGNGVWAVIMSEGSPYGRQTWQTEQTFPEEFIRAKWEEGFRVTDLAFGNGVWTVIMSQDSPFGRQTWQTARRFVP